MNNMTLTVSQLNTYVKAIMDEDRFLKNVTVVGEISNFTQNSRSGHMYMTLKDSEASVKAVMFMSSASRLKYMPQNGLKVIARGRVSVYLRDGQYQLYIESMVPEGDGDISLALEQLKEKLEKQGLFDPLHKKMLPRFPQKIGVITSESGAVFHDITQIIARRFPVCEILFAPVSVQGEGSAQQLIKALKSFDKDGSADIIIIARGGGSVEDLWEFNSEQLAASIYDCTIPVISAVGHETDFTICDYVSDVRAATPSMAAELATPDRDELIQYFDEIGEFMLATLVRGFENKKMRLLLLKSSIENKKTELISLQKNNIERLTLSMEGLVGKIIENKKSETVKNIEKLDALSPLKLLKRGYSVAVKDGKAVSSIKELEAGEQLDVIFSDGQILCSVEKITEREKALN